MQDAHDLATAVAYLATQTHYCSDIDLEQPFTWRAFDEDGIRFALIGTYHELREVAVWLAAERQRQGISFTRTQVALGQYNTAYRDLEGVLVGVTDEEYDREPTPNEWPLRIVLGHTAAAQRNFFSLVHYGRSRQRSHEELPAKMPASEVERIVGPYDSFLAMMETQPMAEMVAFHANLRTRALAEFVDMSDAELDGPSIWRDDPLYNLEYRIHRFDAHLREHTIQAEKTLAMIGRSPNESRRWLRLIYNAFAEVENILLGAEDVGAEERALLAEAICARADEVAMIVHRAWELADVVRQGNLERVQELLSIDPRLANTFNGIESVSNCVPVLMTALYYGRPEIAEALEEAGAELNIFSAAALGRLEAVQAAHQEYESVIHESSPDGYTPLLLACFFGREPVARWLVEQGAAIHVTAKNEMAVQPIHAAAAGADSSLSILTLLLEKGANPNARQSGGFTALHTAAQNNAPTMARLLLAHGADPSLATDDGKTPFDIAQEAGNNEVAEILKG